MSETLNPLRSADGLSLHGQVWPAMGAARGTLLIVHGLGEHVARYGAVASALAQQGWRVLAFDQRGHGRSEGPRGSIASADSMLQDLALMIDSARAESQPGPLVLLGHSMGGLVAARFVAEGLSAQPAPWWRKIDALVLSSPALDLGLGAANRLLLSLLGPLAPHLKLGNGLNPNWISRDPAVVAAYSADLLVHDRVTPALVRFMVDSCELVRSLAARWRVPTLLMWAGADRCVSPQGSADFAAAAPQAVLTAQEYPSLFHEIFNEPERDQVLQTLQRWLAQLPGTQPTEP